MLGKIAVYTIGLAFIFYRVQVYLTSRQEKLDLHVFLEENELSEYEAKLHKFGKFNAKNNSISEVTGW